jgi:beta-lactam-binding protein with PASTA domain
MVETAVDALVGARLDGRYDVVRVIARGGMATVYEALDTRLERPVAVKVMHPALAADPSFVDRFRREATSAARLSHPHVVAVHDQGSAQGLVFLVMELVRGRTLRCLLQARGRLDPGEALELFEPVAAALAAAHATGIVHRDVKPENVLLGDDGWVRVADFGLARAVEASSVTAAAGLLIGTVAYLAPEQVRDGTAVPASDVYSAGVLLFELLTGAVPFTGETPLSVAYQHLHSEVPPLSSLVAGVPRAVEDLVRDATRRDVPDRLGDGAALLAATRHARAGLPTPTAHLTTFLPTHDQQTLTLPAPVRPGRTLTLRRRRPHRAPPPAGRTRHPRRRRLLLTLLVLLTAAAGAGGWWLGSGGYTHAPRVLGGTEAAARTAALKADLTVRLEAAVYDDTVPRDLVARQDPPGGQRLRRNHALVVRLSLGPQLFTVPGLTPGIPPSTARTLLLQENLNVGVSVATYDAGVSRGMVIGTDPKAGAQLIRGTPVKLLVSNGPAPVPVPVVVGVLEADARTALVGAGFTVARRDQSSTTIPEGYVMAVGPPQGSQQVPGTTITLTISSGKPKVSVPSVVGLALDEAQAALQAVGLRSSIVSLGRRTSGTVADQNPQQGSQVTVGSTVALIVIH